MANATDLMGLIHQAGFQGAAANTMYGIVMAESGGNAQAHNPNASTGDNSYGLAQINMLGDMGPARLKQYGLKSNEDLFDPLTNLKVAYKLSGGGTNFSPWTTFTSGAYLNAAPGAVVSNASSSASSTTAGSAAGAPTTAETKQQLLAGAPDWAKGLLSSNPDLQQALNEAVQNGDNDAEFANRITNTPWYRTHADSVKSTLALKASDPAEWAQQVQQATARVTQLAAQSGFQVNRLQAQTIASNLITQGQANDSQAMLAAINGTQDFRKTTDISSLTGKMATASQQLQQLASSYGQTWNPATLAGRAQQIVTGGATAEQYTAELQKQAMVMYPGLATQIQAGHSLSDIAAPYQQAIGNLLEVAPNSLDLNSNLIKQSLQGSDGNDHQPLAIWQSENLARQDPRWQQTSNAKASYASALMNIGQSWGYEG